MTNIENYLKIKEKLIIQAEDYRYLQNIAQILRKQDVRIEDKIPYEIEKRKITLFDVEDNKNLEIEKIIEIIKRNF